MHAVVAAAAVLLGVLLAEIVQQRFAAAHGTLGIGDRLQQQQLADLLLGDRFALHEFLQFLNILITIKGNATSLAAVAAGTSGLLIVSLQTFRYVVVNHEAHVRLVNAHAEGDGGHNHVHLFLQEGVLVVGPRGGIHARMIGQGPDVVGHEQFGQLLDLLAAQAINDTRLAGILLDIFDDLTCRIVFGPDFVEQVGPVERRLEHGGIGHAEILLDVHLHLRSRRCRQGDQRRPADVVHDGTDAPILRAEIVAPLRNAVRLVDGIERHLDLAQERNVVLLGERFGREVEQFGPAGQHILLHLIDRSPVERRVQEVGNSLVLAEGAHGIDLILHQGDQRRDDDRHAVHQQRRQLVAKALAAAGGHQHERVLAGQHIADDRFLIALKSRETEILFQFLMQHVMQIVHVLLASSFDRDECLAAAPADAGAEIYWTQQSFIT